MRYLLLFLCSALLAAASGAADEPQLLHLTYHSPTLHTDRGYLLYLPPHFDERDHWPVIVFLHADGMRGDRPEDVDYLLKHGPMFEAWSQHRDLPFVILAPQMPIGDRAEVDYIKHRTRSEIPRRLPSFRHPIPPNYRGPDRMEGQLAADPPPSLGDPTQRGWITLADDVILLLNQVIVAYRGDGSRVYLTGISLGGFGTWSIAAAHPDRFAAIAPISAFGTPALAAALDRMPIWTFAGGRDPGSKPAYYYAALNELEKRGNPEVRFTIEADLGHDAWRRVYAGEDLYLWFLAHRR